MEDLNGHETSNTNTSNTNIHQTSNTTLVDEQLTNRQTGAFDSTDDKLATHYY